MLLEDLGEGMYDPWQVRQAADAVTLSCGPYRLVQLRVKDLDVEEGTVRARQGRRLPVVLLPEETRAVLGQLQGKQRLVPELKRHLEQVRVLHQDDLAAGGGAAPLPDALHRKYPNAGHEWGWQFVFPSSQLQAAVDGAGPCQSARRAVRRAGYRVWGLGMRADGRPKSGAGPRVSRPRRGV